MASTDSIEMLNSALLRPWLIYEGGRRWTSAVSRFSDHFMPGDLIAAITMIARDGPGAGSSPASRFAPTVRGIVLWEWSRQTPSWAVDELIAISSTRPGVLQFVATHDLPTDQQIMLSELGVSGIVRNPEDLLRFSPLIRGHFQQVS